MNRLKRLADLTLSPSLTPLVLLALAIVAYGLLFPALGFYWDEWPMTWIAQKLGPQGLARYFATNRPYWGMIYQVTTQALGAVPWHWQLFGLFWRWSTAVALWGTLRQVWPRRTDAALYASILFLLYPGFSQQSIAMMFGHFFVVLSAYLLSLWCSLIAVRASSKSKARFAVFTVLALLLGLLNLLAMEYFFLLELLRPGFIYLAVRNQACAEAEDSGAALPPVQTSLRRAALHALPYLALFLAAVIWRAFFFPYQHQNYSFSLTGQLKAAPLQTLLGLAANVARDLFQVTLLAWIKPFTLPDLKATGARTVAVSAGLALVALVALLVYLWKVRSTPVEQRGRQPWAVQAILLGLAGLVLAGPPFWLTGLEIHLTYPNDRFTLPFMLGASLLLAGLIGLLPGRRVYKLALLAVLAAAPVGMHFREAVSFQRDWNAQKAMFWQMAWRIPALQPGSTLISTDLPMKYYSDNSLTGPLNWIYAPENRSQQMAYMFYFASVRSELRPLMETGHAIHQDYLAATFDGSTDQVVALSYRAPACLRVLDPQIDPVNGMLPELMRDTARVGNTQWILPSGSLPDLTPAIFGSEPAHNWCYYFEKADLARQQGDWQQVVSLGEQAFALNDYPNDPMERLPFIEGYAHTGQWQRAIDLSGEAARITPLMQPPLCRLWQRIQRSTSAPQAAAQITALGCEPAP